MDSNVDNLQKLKYLFCSDYLSWRAMDDDEVIIGFNGSFIVGHIIPGTPQRHNPAPRVLNSASTEPASCPSAMAATKGAPIAIFIC